MGEKINKEGKQKKVETPKEKVKIEEDPIEETKKSEIKRAETQKTETKENNKKSQENPKEKAEELVEKVKKEMDREQVKIDVDKTEYKKVEVNKKSKKPIFVITVIILFAILFSVIFALLNITNTKIMSGVSIMEVDVSNLNKQEAKEKLQKVVDTKLEEELILKYKDYETNISAKQIGGKFDIDSAIDNAYNIGRSGNIITNNYEILQAKFFKKDVKMKLDINEKALNKEVKNVSAKMPGAVKQSSYYIEDDKLIIVRGKKGIVVKQDELKNIIRQEMLQINNKYEIAIIPIEEKEPEPVDIEKIQKEIYKEPKNAYVSKNPTKVHTHVNGVDFGISIEEAKKLLQEDKKEYVIPLKITVPERTIKDLGEEAFPNLLATYTTRYDPSNKNRSNNIAIAASKINGTIMMPGETFSYNKVVGARTIEAGYKLAGAYSGGKVVQDVGGGICQVSSTLYNTALLANLEIIDRTNHLFLTGYVAESRDATVSWGNIDFKFKNSRTYPVKIVASAENGVCKIDMYGIKEDTEYEVIIQSNVLSYIPYTVKYEEDKTLKEGREVIEQSGYNGCKSEAYRILKKNGKVISRTLLSRDTYEPMQRIVKKGIKK